MQLKPEEISKVIRSQIKYYENAIRQDENLRMEVMEWHRTSRKTAYLSFYSVPARTSARDSL